MAERQSTNPRVVPTESVYDDVVDVVVDDDQQNKNTASGKIEKMGWGMGSMGCYE